MQYMVTHVIVTDSNNMVDLSPLRSVQRTPSLLWAALKTKHRMQKRQWRSFVLFHVRNGWCIQSVEKPWETVRLVRI